MVKPENQYIDDIGPKSRAMVKDAVRFAIEVWPNSHLGSHTTREDIASAFHYIRARVKQGMSLYCAASDLYNDCYRYQDM